MITNSILISVIMSVYNEPLGYIESSIKSILNQTFKNLEFIIVIDNPQREDIIRLVKAKSKNDSRIKLVTNKKNIGLVKSLNHGLSLANGEYVARMDADDISLPDRLEKQLGFIIDNELDLVGCNIKRIDEDDNLQDGQTDYPLSDKTIKKFLKIDNPIPHPTWLVRKDVFINNNYVDFPACEDYEMLTRLVAQGKKFGNLSDAELYYRMNSDSISSTKKALQKTSKFYICKQYRRGKISVLSEFNAYLKSPAGKRKERNLANYYRALTCARDALKSNKIFGVFKYIQLLICFIEARTAAANKVRKFCLKVACAKDYGSLDGEQE